MPAGDLVSRRRSTAAVANATFRVQATTPDVGETPTAVLLFRWAKKFSLGRTTSAAARLKGILYWSARF
jgi:hypothetical protein